MGVEMENRSKDIVKIRERKKLEEIRGSVGET